MDIEKFFDLLFKLYGEQENLKIEYELFFLEQNVSNSNNSISNIEGNLSKYYLSRSYIEVDLYNYRLVVYFYAMYGEEKYYFSF